MVSHMSSVNKPRSKRAQRALETRRRMRDSARDLFVSQGYPATTMAQIAQRSGVAVQTLYYSFQSKGKLLIEIIEVVAAGEDNPVPVPQREWFQEMMAATDAQRVLGLLVEHGCAIYERVAFLWPVVNTALSDADVATYWDGISQGRRRSQHAQAARIAELADLRPGLTVEQAGDLVCLLTGHAPYRELVQEAGWSMLDYQAWLFTSLVTQLLGAPVNADAYGDLSFANHVQGA